MESEYVGSNYCPLFLQAIDIEGESWEISFQTKPDYRVFFRGDKVPSASSILRVLDVIPNTPVMMVYIIQTIAGQCLYQQGENK